MISIIIVHIYMLIISSSHKLLCFASLILDPLILDPLILDPLILDPLILDPLILDPLILNPLILDSNPGYLCKEYSKT
jgi:hypothetical protein